MSRKRRAGLVAYARSSGSWVVEDDYDGEIRYAGAAPVAVKALDQAERVIHIGSFSKTLLPSLRLGYMVVPADLAGHFAHARMIVDRHPPILEQAVMADFLNRGFFAAHIRQMRQFAGLAGAAGRDRLGKRRPARRPARRAGLHAAGLGAGDGHAYRPAAERRRARQRRRRGA